MAWTINEVQALAAEVGGMTEADGVGHLCGVLTVAQGGKERHLWIVDGPVTSSRRPTLHWQTAPLAEIFFSCDEGDDYEVEVGDNTLEGEVVSRALITVEAGRLKMVQTAQGRFETESEGGWTLHPPSADGPVAPRPPTQRGVRASAIEVHLDEGQQAVVDAAPDQSLLIIGEAGFGKSTAALHRLVRLRREALDGDRAFAALLLVPTEGLRRLSLDLLARLGVQDVTVHTVDGFIASEGRRLFDDLPAQNSRDASLAVIWLKRSPYLREALPAFAARRREREITAGGAPRARRRDLLHLFGDSVILDAIAARSQGFLSPLRVAEILEHTHVQFSRRTEEVYHDVDAERLKTSDGRLIDDGTPTQDAGTIDVEDIPVMFELHRLKTGAAPPTLGRWQHILLDEAQEVAPMELAVIGQALAPGGTLSVVGDAHQQVDETAFYEGWDHTLAELSIPLAPRHRLEVSHRCPAGVMNFASAVVSSAPVSDLRALAQSPQTSGLSWSAYPHSCHLFYDLSQQLMAVQRLDPQASTAVICRTPALAEAFAARLQRVMPVRLALKGSFASGGGVNVTCVEEVKGLEFDTVVVPDVGGGRWLSGARERRALYVAVTRATWQVWLLTD